MFTCYSMNISRFWKWFNQSEWKRLPTSTCLSEPWSKGTLSTSLGAGLARDWVRYTSPRLVLVHPSLGASSKTRHMSVPYLVWLPQALGYDTATWQAVVRLKHLAFWWSCLNGTRPYQDVWYVIVCMSPARRRQCLWGTRSTRLHRVKVTQCDDDHAEVTSDCHNTVTI
jgi:hypothetical protein